MSESDRPSIAAWEAEAFRQVVESVPDFAVFLLDPQGRVERWGAGAERLLGYAANEVVGRPVDAFYTPEDRAAGLPRLELEQALATGRAGEDRWCVRKDGTRFWSSGVVTPVRDEDGTVVGFTRVLRDRTDLRQAMDDLRASEERYRAVVEDMTDVVCRLRADRTFVFANGAFGRLVGVTPSDLIGRRGPTVAYPDDVPRVEATLATLSPSAPVVRVENRVTDAAGGVRWMEFVNRGFFGPAGELVEFQAVGRDVTDRKRLDENLARDAFLLASVNDAVVVTDLDGVVTYWNGGAARLFGWTADEMVGRPMTDRVPEAGRAAMAAAIRAIRDGQEFSGEWEDYRKDGSRVWIDSRTRLVHDPDGRPAAILGVSHDISGRKRAEAERDALLRRLQLQIDRMPIGCILHDAAGRMVGWNPAAERIFGYTADEVRDRGYDLLVPDAERARVNDVAQRLLGGEPFVHSVNRNRTKGGREITCEWHNALMTTPDGAVEGVVSMVSDVTERLGLEQRVREVERLEAVGQLAGGVAHEFNNLLTVIRGYAQVLLGERDDCDPSRSFLAEIDAAAGRAADLTRQLLSFGRRQMMQPRLLDLNDIVTGMEAAVREAVGPAVRLVTDLSPGVGRVRIDPALAEEVVSSLVASRRDAMPGGGTVTIATRDVVVGPDAAVGHANLPPGRYSVLEVADTGTGMPPGVLAHVFEPFFTTEGVGRGAGLGLAAVYGIARQAGGHAAAVSELGKGSTFCVYLPVVPDDGPGGTPAPGGASASGGETTVLLAEDSAGVRGLARHLLSSLGFTVLEAGSGDDALGVAARHPGRIDLLVTDVVMPGLPGPQLAQRLRGVRPDLRVLYVSGYADVAVFRHGLLEPGSNFIQKPFTRTAFAQKVLAVLAGTG